MSRQGVLGSWGNSPASLRAAVAGLATALLLAAAASARETPTHFERDYETAQQLHELYERLEDADTLFMLDSFDDAIVAGGCREADRAYSEALAEARKLAARKRAGESLTYDEERYYEDRLAAEGRLWKEFEDCYTEQLRRPIFRNNLPPGIHNYSTAVGAYNELREKNQWQQDGEFDAVAAKIEQEIEDLESQPAYIGTVTSVFRRVELSRKGSTRPLRRGDKIMLRDVISTGPRGRTRIELHDRIEEKNAGPTVVNIGSASEVEMERFHVSFDKDKGFLDSLAEIVRGSIRAFTKGFGGRAAFSIRSGVSLCGIRGTDIEIDYQPELEEVVYRLHDGAVEIATPGGKVILEPGQALTVQGGVAGAVRPIGEPEAEGPPA